MMKHMENEIKNYMGIRVRSIALFVLFISAISLPILDYVIFISGEYENTENRNKAKLPDFDLSMLDPFPDKFDKYYADNHNFRGELLYINKRIKYDVFNIVPSKAVTQGKDGWLYRTDYVDTYINHTLFTNLEIDSLHNMMKHRSEWLQKQGVKNYIAIIPTKSQVYTEKLPDHIRQKNSTSRTMQFMNAMKGIPNLKVFYLQDTLLVAKENAEYNLFYKTDQHWNSYGALFGMTSIINNLREDFPEIPYSDIDNYKIDTTVTKGKGLARTLMLQNEISDVEIKVNSINTTKFHRIDTVKYSIPEVFPYKKEYQFFYTTGLENRPKALIIRDSFTNAFRELLPEYFGETTMIWDVWCYELNKDIVLNEKPDFFLTIIIEANLPFIIHKHPTMRKK